MVSAIRDWERQLPATERLMKEDRAKLLVRGSLIKYFVPSLHLIETIGSTASGSFVPPVSLSDECHRPLNPVADTLIGYYLSVNTNCFPISFSVKRISTLPASWVSARNKEDNLGSVSRSAGERYLR